jgi:hypothetical protein
MRVNQSAYMLARDLSIIHVSSGSLFFEFCRRYPQGIPGSLNFDRLWHILLSRSNETIAFVSNV